MDLYRSKKKFVCRDSNAGIAAAFRDFKFGTLIYHSKSHPADEKSSLKGAWSGSREQFLHLIVDSENFATASCRYTGDIHISTVVGLFVTPIRQ